MNGLLTVLVVVAVLVLVGLALSVRIVTMPIQSQGMTDAQERAASILIER